MIFDYFKIIIKKSKAYLELSFKIYNYFSNLKHDCFFLINLKYVYFIILLYFKDRYYFIFIIFEIN